MKMIGLIILLLAGVYLLLGLALFLVQDQLIFFPETYPEAKPWPYPDAEEVWIHRSPAKLNGLLFHASEARGAVVYFHGNAGNLADWGSIAPDFTRLGFHILIMDYRGYGKSRGKRSEAALKDDALAAFDWLKTRFPDIPLVVYGRSLGSGPAAWVGANRDIQGLVLESPYTAITDEAARRFPIFPVKKLVRYHLPVIDFLEEVPAPILLIHGTGDQILPARHSHELLAAHQHKDIEMVLVDGAGHNNLGSFDVYHVGLKNFLLENVVNRN